MPKAIELLRQGRHQEIWQMCCGYLNMDIEQFMAIQKRLLLGQIETLNRSVIGKKIFNGAQPQTVDDFRKEVPLTSYSAYCPELSERKEDCLPARTAQWVHTSGRTGEYSCKWVPLSEDYVRQLGPIIYGLGLISASNRWGDLRPFVEKPKMIYTVAPRPYVSGALASILQDQTPSNYLPSLAQAEKLSFEDRIRLGFEEALSEGLDYFFGLSLVLASVGEKFSQSSGNVNLMPLLSHPKALMRLTMGMLKSRKAGRPLMPRDLWKVKGIITSGLDSSIYKEKIKDYWGKYPLNIYASTEGGIVATQTWDYEGMTFIPNLNFLEFIPEQEHFKWQMDHKYQPKTILLDEVKAGECYEIVLTSFHGGSLIRYRIGDMVRITSLRNDKLGINIPQMVFERRCDDLLDFVVIRITEKTLWQALENTGIPYTDWVAYKKPGEPVLNFLLELKDSRRISEYDMSNLLYREILKADNDIYTNSNAHNDLANMIKFKLNLNLLPQGAFSAYIAQKRAEGADIAHLKPPHINPPHRDLGLLLRKIEAAPETKVSPTSAVKAGSAG